MPREGRLFGFKRPFARILVTSFLLIPLSTVVGYVNSTNEPYAMKQTYLFTTKRRLHLTLHQTSSPPTHKQCTWSEESESTSDLYILVEQ